MALRQEYTLGHSSFNDFLYAFVGEEANGQQLTVLSALARLGLNPWAEASRLSELSRDAATKALAALIGRLPEGNWKKSDIESIADGLVRYLPDGKPGSQTLPQSASSRKESPKPAIDLRKSLFWGTLIAVVVVLIVRQLME